MNKDNNDDIETLDINNESNNVDNENTNVSNGKDMSDPDNAAGSKFGQFASGIASGLSHAKDLKDQYEAGGLGGVLKNAAKEGLTNKAIDSLSKKAGVQDEKPPKKEEKPEKKPESSPKKDDGQEKYKSKKNNGQKKEDGKESPKKGENGKPGEPDSVKKKKGEINEKNKNDREKAKSENKSGKKSGKKDINEKAFRGAVKKGAGALGSLAGAGSLAGKAADKILDSPLGKEPIEAARNASNAGSAIAKGMEKLLQIFKRLTTIKSSVYLAPVVVVLLVVIIIAMSFSTKISAGASYASGGIDEVSKSDPRYEDFYKAIDEYGGTNKLMVIAVLTGYKDNDSFTPSCTQEEIDSGDENCVQDENDTVLSTSNSKMKKYIKEVAKAISDSGGNVEEGSYNDPENTGSTFFKWLYTDFIEEYYHEYIPSNDDEKKDKIVYIIRYIYMYYEELLRNQSSSGGLTCAVASSSVCPNGITVAGKGTFELEEYIAGVVGHENYWDGNGSIEAMKAQAVAARTYAMAYTNNCQKEMCNGPSCQAFFTKDEILNNVSMYGSSEAGRQKAWENLKRAADETSGQVLYYNGKQFDLTSMYDAFGGSCNSETCTGTYIRVPSTETHTVTMPRKYLEGEWVLKYSHNHGMSQDAARYLSDQGKTYEEILKFFYAEGTEISGGCTAQIMGDQKVYGNEGIYAQSIFPIATDYKNIYVTQGYRYSNGGAHGAVDIFCKRDRAKSQSVSDLRAFCNSIPIISAHAGTIVSMNNSYCASTVTRYGKPISNMDTSLPRTGGICYGLGLNIRITDQSDPYYGYNFVYYHFEKFADGIKVGAQISQGQLLGYMGSTGISTGWHLHFGIQKVIGGKYVGINQNNTIRAFCKNTGLGCNKLKGDGEGPQG